MPISAADTTNLMVTQDEQCRKAQANQQAWMELTNPDRSSSHVTQMDTLPNAQVFRCIKHALLWALSGRPSPLPPTSTTPPPLPPTPSTIHEATHIQLLVTGSLHLVGAVMKTLGFSVDDM